MNRRWNAVKGLFLLLGAVPAAAAEPNENFASATVLGSGIRSLVDELTVEHVYPDTFLGIRSPSGEIIATDDDGSRYGDGFASGVQSVGIPTEEIRFDVTGFGDPNFLGDHSESGEYEVLIDIYDAFGSFVQSINETRGLSPGNVNEFFYTDSSWVNGRYDVNVNNRMAPNDIDFFTFTGLTPGEMFAARTRHTNNSDVDTLLGWFDDAGALLESNDDDGGGKLSLIDGVVPAGGSLTFAITAFGDRNFLGFHSDAGGYELELLVGAGPLSGDYNGNAVVDAADYTVWRDTFGQAGQALAADGDQSGEVNAEDYDVWKAHFGESVGASSAFAVHASNVVPERSTIIVMGIALLVRPRGRMRQKKQRE